VMGISQGTRVPPRASTFSGLAPRVPNRRISHNFRITVEA
jgi:hypothetical protein